MHRLDTSSRLPDVGEGGGTGNLSRLFRVRHVMGNLKRQSGRCPSDVDESRRPIRVGLNAHLLSQRSDYRGAGLSRYIHYLLASLPCADSYIEYHAFVHDQELSHKGWKVHRTGLPTSSPWARILWEQFVQPALLKRHEVQLTHGPVYVAPLNSPCRCVVTVHDLGFVRCPEHLRSSSSLYLRLFTRLSVHRASKIIAVSGSTKRDLLRWVNLDPERVEVIHHGVEEAYHPIRDSERMAAFRQRRSLPEKMILYVGTLEPRKNVETLIRAYARLKRRSVVPHILVVGGARGWRYEGIFAVAEQLGLSGEVIFPGFLPQNELPLWYNAADLFVYPSMYEGFGWPPLEAMACGVPVITSNASSLPEVVGEAALTVDPHDVDGLVDAMYSVLSVASVGERLSHAGRERSSEFTWERTARATARVYRQAATQWIDDDD